MKQLVIVLLISVIIVCTAGLSQASYYDVKLNIGEYVSQISKQLFLATEGQISGYDLKTEVKINKDYRFLAGKSYEEDWEINDYFLSLQSKDKKLELGKTTSDSISYFVAADSLLGASATAGDYNLWYGENYNQEFSFGGQSSGLERVGFTYDGQKRKYSYHYQEDLVTDRHYFSYQDGYKLNKLDLVVDTTMAATAEKTASAVRFDLSSWYNGFNLRGTASYYAPEWQEIEQEIFASGEYDLALQVYKKLNKRYILETVFDYNRDNLDDSQSFTNREWSINNNLSYFSPQQHVYQLGVDYQVNNYGENQLHVNLNGEVEAITIDLNYKQQAEQEFYLELDYEQPNYSYDLNYRLAEEGADWLHDAELEAEYKWDLTAAWQSTSLINLAYFYDDYRINITQGLDYDISSQHSLEGKLSLNHYFGSDDLTQKVIFNYRYQF